jgi:hypothetical protein
MSPEKMEGEQANLNTVSATARILFLHFSVVRCLGGILENLLLWGKLKWEGQSAKHSHKPGYIMIKEASYNQHNCY